MAVRFRPSAEPVEGRVLLTQFGALGPNGFMMNPPGYHLVRPNTPVAPFGSPLATATFVDPTVRIHHGDHVVVGQKSFIGPYAALDASFGFIKIGSNSEVLDNAFVTASPAGRAAPTNVFIGDNTSVGYGAVVNGPARIGGYNTTTTDAFGNTTTTKSANTGVGPNAVIDGATVEPGAVVGALAYVGPGVTVPAGYYVLPGARVLTDAEASTPALGMVEKLPDSVKTDLSTEISRAAALANGYAYLYQGQSATGTSPGIDPTVKDVFNGNLAAVLGTSQEPGPSSSTASTGIDFEPKKTGPKFPGPHRPAVEGLLPTFPARITGDARFLARAHTVARTLGRLNAIRADQGQPLYFDSAPSTGQSVVINSPLGGTVTTTTITGTEKTSKSDGTTKITINDAKTTTSTKTNGSVTIGSGFLAGDHAVILGGSGSKYTIGDNVNVGSYAVVSRSNLGSNVVVGAKSYVSDSTVPDGTIIPPGTVMIKNKVTGQVQW